MIRRAAIVLLAPLALVACGGAAATQTNATAPTSKPAKTTAKVEAGTKAKTPEQRAEDKLLQNLAQASQSPGFGGSEVLSFAKIQRQGGAQTQRAQVDPISFRVGNLPLAKVPEPLVATAAPKSLIGGDEPPELVLDWRGADAVKAKSSYTTVRISLKDVTVGRLRIGSNEAPITGGGGGGVYVTCGGEPSARTNIVPVRWETVGSAAGGAARFTIVDAWFDPHTCKAAEVKRTSIDARSLAGGVLYGFRETCVPSPRPVDVLPSGSPQPAPSAPSCAPGESLTLLGPRLQHVVATGVGGDARTTLGSFSRITLPLRRGGGGSLVERIAAGSLREWFDASGSRATFSQDLLLGVEVIQAVDDPEPIAVAYVSEDRG